MACFTIAFETKIHKEKAGTIHTVFKEETSKFDVSKIKRLKPATPEKRKWKYLRWPNLWKERK